MRKKYTEEDLSKILKLQYEKHFEKAKSYQEGSCYDLALTLSDFCIKNKIEHKICELYTIEFDGFENRNYHFFIEINNKVYDSFVFGGNEKEILNNFEYIEGNKKIEKTNINLNSPLNSIGALSMFMKDYKLSLKEKKEIDKIKYTKEDIKNYLELEYYKNKSSAISYQTGGCYNLANNISEFCIKNNIKHKICELYTINSNEKELGYKDWENTFKNLKLETEKDINNFEINNSNYIIDRGTHYFINIENKIYDSFNFAEPDEKQIYYQFENVEGFKFTLYEEININKEKIYNIDEIIKISKKINFYKKEIEKNGIEKLKMLYAIENNKNNNERQYLHSLSDLPYYEELIKRKEKKVLNKEEMKILQDINTYSYINRIESINIKKNSLNF